MEKRIHWGELDVIARLLEDMAPEFEELWNEGSSRLTPGDCKRLAVYLSRIRVSGSRLRDTLKLFEALARMPGAQVLISNAIKHETNLQEQAVKL